MGESTQNDMNPKSKQLFSPARQCPSFSRNMFIDPVSRGGRKEMSQKRDRVKERGTVFTEAAAAAAYLSIGGRDKQKPSEQTERSWSRTPQRLMVT